MTASVDPARRFHGVRARALLPRAINYVDLLRESLACGARRRASPDVVLCMTDPPVIADVALAVARRFGVPLVVISQDVFPEIAVELKRLESEPLIVAMLREMIAFYLRRADHVVAIGETMRGASKRRARAPTGSPSSRTGSTRRRSIPSRKTTSGRARTGSTSDSS